ncbi:MAG: TetR/AcrR family transcriptional regulator, partial [Syntrophales bacterium]|nr:TetR/AcrR family transcriptional regulator [Syntrophales bacterium]
TIAGKAGVGLNTIYMYYENKERLLFSFVDTWIIQLDLTLADHLQGLEDCKEKLRKIIWVILDFYEKNVDIAKIVLLTVPFKTWMADVTFKQKDTAMRIIGLFREGQEQGKFDSGIPAELMFDLLYGTMHRITYMWIYLGKKKRLTDYSGICFDMIWRAIEKKR